MATSATPVYLLTGFLGSGKTTLLNHWLKQPEFGDVAVIVNEFGAVGIDNDLIARSDEDTIELTTGCLCCTVRGSLVETLMSLLARRDRGDVRKFNSVVIETTGLADPAPVIQALMTTPVSSHFRLAKVITTVEAPQGLSTLDRYPEALKQVAVADDVVITKNDLAGDGKGDVEARLKSINPGAAFHFARLDDAPPIAALLASGQFDLSARSSNIRDWLKAEPVEAQGHHHHDVNRHNSEIGSFVITFDEPLVWQEVAAWLDALVIAHGQDMLRIKGILDIEGRDRPIVVQAVQKLFHPPFALDAWPDGKKRSKLVFITRAIKEDFVREVFDIIRSARRPLPEEHGDNNQELIGATL